MSVPAEIRLRSCVTLEKGKPPAAQPYFGLDADRYLTPEYLRAGGECALVKAAPRAARVEDGDTILLWDGSNAGEVLYGRAGVLASTMSRASHADRFDDTYFFYALKQWEPYLKGQTSGSAIPHIDKEIFGNLAIIEFDLCEQSKIAEVLSTVDRAIEQTEALIAKQQRIKTGLMQDLLTRGIDKHGNLRSEQTHEFKDSPLGRIPVEWECHALSKITCKLITYGIVQPGPHIADGIPFVQTKDLASNTLDVRKLDRTSREIHHSYERSSIRTGDVLIGIRASVGSVAFVPSDLDYSNISRGIARVSPALDVNGRYLLWALQAERTQNAIRLEIKGSTYPEITLPALRAIVVSLPGPEEQAKTSAILDAVDAELEQVSQILSKLRALKHGLMQDLLTGQRRVTALLQQSEKSPA